MTDVTRKAIYRASRLFVAILRMLLAGAAGAFLVFAPLSYFYSDYGLSLVKQHFDEPSSFYPAASVMLFMVCAALLAGLSSYYLTQVLKLISVDPPKDHQRGATLSRPASRMAWALLAMSIVVWPMGTVALEVETAFKGPTSEVTRPYWIPAGLALIGAFALASALRRALPFTDR